MAFLVQCILPGYEVRAVTRGVSKKGNEFRSIRVESPDGDSTCEISCTRSELFPQVDGLRKAMVCNFNCVAVSGRERSYISLVDSPVIVEA